MLDIEMVAEGLQFPEGPIALADGSVLLVEIQARTLSRIGPDGRHSVVARFDGGPNGAALGPDGAVYVTNNGGSFGFYLRDGLNLPGPPPVPHRGGRIERVDLATGEVHTLYDHCDGRPLGAPNDLVFDRSGGFWFTDHGASDAEGRRHGGLYYARADGSSIRQAAGPLVSPNGVGLSPDEDVVYVADTQLGRLWAFDISGPGTVARVSRMQPGRVVANLPGFQLLDSLAVEADGRVCVATIANGGITTFAPDGSTEHLPLPDPLCTNLCFGGADLRDVWVTASGTGKLYKLRWPRPGLKLNFSDRQG
ncbi:SMP-30/gluconolactonase/LRE family protein [Caldimonas brevitalea]|uniref:Gluconolaconase n=1 Tax=Caldimonas brevitalea TaxID=413882 RepID=A0A0G3BK12_9BURK|nr:gluconolaconase [Caldimonas brevitalea]